MTMYTEQLPEREIKSDSILGSALDSIATNEIHNKIASQAARLGLRRLAGNMYVCPSTKDFWKVKGGKLFRLPKTSVVDNGEKVIAADAINPEATLNAIMNDLTF